MASNVYANIHSTKHTGKVALVTGGSTGLGLASATRLA
jgi:NAD(P)-dependent dehydrogenase (short-subunit alcohol dehydrogenase family)